MKYLKRLRYLGTLFLLILSTVQVVSAEQNEVSINNREGEFVPGQVIVGMKPNRQVSRSRLSSELFPGIEVANVEVLLSKTETPTNIRSTKETIGEILLLELVEADKQSVIDAIGRLEEHPDVEYVEPDYIVYRDDLLENTEQILSPLNNTTLLWNMERIGLAEAWNITRGNASIKVGVIDSGIDHTHPNLTSNVDTSLGYDFILNRQDASDVHGHGTHIAGVIGASGINNRHVVGVAPDVTMIPLRVLNEQNSGSYSNFIRAIDYANSLGLDLINFSISGENYSQGLENAIRAFNGLFVAAAGNNSRDIDISPRYPAALDLPNMITVANSTETDERRHNSNIGRRSVELFAPGTSILSTLRGNSFGNMNGTSMATPHVVGAAVLALSVNPSLTPVELRSAILETVEPVPAFANLSVTGGILNVERLVVYVSEGEIEERPEIPSEPEKPELPAGVESFDLSRRYLGGDIVSYEGNLYRAQWAIQGGSPATSAAWEQIETVYEDGSIDFRMTSTYFSGNIVRYEGNLYRAQWWTRGDNPATESVWQLIGEIRD